MNKEIKEILLKFNKEVEKAESARNPFSSEDKKFKHILIALSEEHFNIFKDILDYITNLQQKVDQYENPDDLTLFYMWLDEKAKDKMKQLEDENERLKELDENYPIEEQLEETLKREKEYKSRNEKAIEFIEKNLLPSHSIKNTDWEFEEVIYSDLPVEAIKPLVDILQGVDKE